MPLFPFVKQKDTYVCTWSGDTLQEALDKGLFGPIATPHMERTLKDFHRVYDENEGYDEKNFERDQKAYLEAVYRDLSRADGTFNVLNGSYYFWEGNSEAKTFGDKTRINIVDNFKEILTQELTSNKAVQNLAIRLLGDQGFTFSAHCLLVAKFLDITSQLVIIPPGNADNSDFTQRFFFTPNEKGGVDIKIETHVILFSQGANVIIKSDTAPFFTLSTTYEIVPEGNGARISIKEIKESIDRGYIEQSLKERDEKNKLGYLRAYIDFETAIKFSNVKMEERAQKNSDRFGEDYINQEPRRDLLLNSIDTYIGINQPASVQDNMPAVQLEKQENKLKALLVDVRKFYKLFANLRRSFNVFFNLRRFVKAMNEIAELKRNKRITDSQIKELLLSNFSLLQLVDVYKKINLMKNKEHEPHKKELVEFNSIIEEIWKEEQISMPFVLLEKVGTNKENVTPEVEERTKKIIAIIDALKTAKKFGVLKLKLFFNKIFFNIDNIFNRFNFLNQYLLTQNQAEAIQNEQIIKNYLAIHFNSSNLIELLKTLEKLIAIKKSDPKSFSKLEKVIEDILHDRGISDKFINKSLHRDSKVEVVAQTIPSINKDETRVEDTTQAVIPTIDAGEPCDEQALDEDSCPRSPTM